MKSKNFKKVNYEDPKFDWDAAEAEEAKQMAKDSPPQKILKEPKRTGIAPKDPHATPESI